MFWDPKYTLLSENLRNCHPNVSGGTNLRKSKLMYHTKTTIVMLPSGYVPPTLNYQSLQSAADLPLFGHNSILAQSNKRLHTLLVSSYNQQWGQRNSCSPAPSESTKAICFSSSDWKVRICDEEQEYSKA